jgi:hypothetical protein
MNKNREKALEGLTRIEPFKEKKQFKQPCLSLVL